MQQSSDSPEEEPDKEDQEAPQLEADTPEEEPYCSAEGGEDTSQALHRCCSAEGGKASQAPEALS